MTGAGAPRDGDSLRVQHQSVQEVVLCVKDVSLEAVDGLPRPLLGLHDDEAYRRTTEQWRELIAAGLRDAGVAHAQPVLGRGQPTATTQ